jgi:hypothetical protein
MGHENTLLDHGACQRHKDEHVEQIDDLVGAGNHGQCATNAIQLQSGELHRARGVGVELQMVDRHHQTSRIIIRKTHHPLLHLDRIDRAFFGGRSGNRPDRLAREFCDALHETVSRDDAHGENDQIQSDDFARLQHTSPA